MLTMPMCQCDSGVKCCSGIKHSSGVSVSGLGFGFMSGAFSVVNILADSVGPGTVGIHGDSQHYFLSSGTNAHRNFQCLDKLLAPVCT